MSHNPTMAKYRPLTFGVTRATLRDGAPGTHYLSADQDLPPFPERITDRLVHWANTRPTPPPWLPLSWPVTRASP